MKKLVGSIWFRLTYGLVYDASLVSFPKSGRTWLRLMIGRAIMEHYGITDGSPLELTELNDKRRGIPRIHVHHDHDKPQFKTRYELEKSKKMYRGTKVILLVRDPRDVIVSMYFYRIKRLKWQTDALPEYLRSPRGSLDTLIAWYNNWLRNRNTPHVFHLVRYEDIHGDTVGELRKIFDVLGMQHVPTERLREAAEFSRFDRMKEMETNRSFGDAHARFGIDLADPEAFKVRRGKIGGYVDYLSVEDIEYAETIINRELDPSLGYNYVTKPVHD